MPREIRQGWLSSHYCFECKCLACDINYPLLSELKKSNSSITLPWRCLECHGIIENGLCLECQKPLKIEKMTEKLDLIQKSMEKNKNECCLNSNEKVMEIYAEFCKNLAELTTLLGPHCEIAIENDSFFRALLLKMFGNKSV